MTDAGLIATAILQHPLCLYNQGLYVWALEVKGLGDQGQGDLHVPQDTALASSYLELHMMGMWLPSVREDWTLRSLATRWESADASLSVSLASLQLPVARVLVFSIMQLFLPSTPPKGMN